MSREIITKLNEMVQIIDSRASELKDTYYDLSPGQKAAQKKLVGDLIEDGLNLATRVQPTPTDLIQDLKKLAGQINDLP